MSTVDLDAYFERIGWGGAVRPTLETLGGVLAAHMARIPFENLDVLLGRPLRLDLEGLQAKMVRGRRGGYCFEHATLLGAALEQIGFRLSRHTARVTVLSPRSQSPRTHMLLAVALPEGTFVLDPGFGALAPRVPVPLAAGREARADREVHRMLPDGRHWILQADVDGKQVDAWATALEDDVPLDFELGNHFTATHPTSPFVNRLMLRALIPGGRVSAMNRDVRILRDGEARAFQLADRAALRGLLAEHFGFDLPEVEKLRIPTVPEWS